MRITRKDLEILVNRLNVEAKTPLEWPKIGHYCLSCAYGGYSLHQLVNEKGGVRDVFNCGHIKGRELYQMICAYILGLNEAKQTKQLVYNVANRSH